MTDEQAERYYRQILLKEIGAEGQLRLMAAKVLVVGAGGLGSPAALYLVAGSSAGGALAAALKAIDAGLRGNVVTLFPDRGDRYFTKGLFAT